MSLKVLSHLEKEHLVPGQDWDRVLWHNGHLFSSGYSSGDVKIWSPTLKPVGELHAHDYPIYDMTSEGGEGSMSTSPKFFTSSSDCSIKHWEHTEDGNFILLGTLEGHTEPPRKLRFDPGRKFLYSGDELGKVLIWEDDKLIGSLETMEEIWEMIVHGDVLITARLVDVVINTVSQKGDKFRHSIRNTVAGKGPFLITKDDRLCFVDRNNFQIHVNEAFTTGNPNLAKMEGHFGVVNAMGEHNGVLYTGGGDGKLIAWDLRNFAKIDTLLWDGGYINSLTISGDGVVYIGGQDKNISGIQLT